MLKVMEFFRQKKPNLNLISECTTNTLGFFNLAQSLLIQGLGEVREEVVGLFGLTQITQLKGIGYC